MNHTNRKLSYWEIWLSYSEFYKFNLGCKLQQLFITFSDVESKNLIRHTVEYIFFSKKKLIDIRIFTKKFLLSSVFLSPFFSFFSFHLIWFIFRLPFFSWIRRETEAINGNSGERGILSFACGPCGMGATLALYIFFVFFHLYRIYYLLFQIYLEM